jgi:hypothetical protein
VTIENLDTEEKTQKKEGDCLSDLDDGVLSFLRADSF